MRMGYAGRVALGTRSSWVASRSLPQHEAPGVLSPKQGPSPWGLSPGEPSTPCTNAELRKKQKPSALLTARSCSSALSVERNLA